jgi:uncharacterized membrane-anchored protein
MLLRMTPRVGIRYWVSILIASMLGTNLGDFLPDVVGLSALAGMCVLAVAFAAIVILDRLPPHGSEAFYWLAILVVRAAATIVADFTIDRQHLGYLPVSVVLAVLLATLVLLHRRDGPKPTSGDLPPTNAFYWATMLVAGSLGTVIGDGMGHAFGPVQIGVPVSVLLATLFLVAFLGARQRLNWTTAASYWIAVVGVRWWGTNAGDILKFLLSIWVSMAITGGALTVLLILWRSRPTVRDEAIPA